MIVELEKVSGKIWDSALKESRTQGTIFQSTHWAEYLRNAFGDRPIYLASIDNKGDFECLLLVIESCYGACPALTSSSKHGIIFGKVYKNALSPMFRRILPFIYWEHGPVFLLESSKETLPRRKRIFEEMMGKVVDIAERRGYYAIKFARPAFWNDYHEIFSKFGFEGKKMGTILIDLEESIDVLWKRVHRKTRHNIQKLEKKVDIIEVSNLDELKDFYCLHVQATKRLKTKTYPFSYYEKLWNNFRPRNEIAAFVAYLKNMPIGTSISIMYNNIIHEYIYGDSNYARINRIYVNDLLKWNTIKWARERGFKYFDLSGVELYKIDKGDEKARNIFFYKSKWGGQLVEYHDYKKTFKEKKLVTFLNRFLIEGEGEHT